MNFTLGPKITQPEFPKGNDHESKVMTSTWGVV